MTWLVWRRQRAALLLLAALAVATITVLVVGRISFLDAVADTGAAQSCLTDQECANTQLHTVLSDYRVLWGLGHSFLLISPLLVGLLAGSSLFGRDIEEETYVFALTQDVSHRRWWATNLIMCGGAVVVAAAVVSAVAGWAYRPLAAAVGMSILETPRFEDTGIVPVAYALLAFSVAATAGLIARSTPAGIVVACLVYGIVLFGLSVIVRAHYLPAEIATTPLTELGRYVDAPDGSWRISSAYVDAAGNTLPDSAVDPGDTACSAPNPPAGCLGQGGVSVRLAYQPLSRYWPFQLIESAITVLLAGAALTVGRERIRHLVH